jgi:hypothetical protein
MAYKIIVEKEKCFQCGALVNPDQFWFKQTLDSEGNATNTSGCSMCYLKEKEKGKEDD